MTLMAATDHFGELDLDFEAFCTEVENLSIEDYS